MFVYTYVNGLCVSFDSMCLVRESRVCFPWPWAVVLSKYRLIHIYSILKLELLHKHPPNHTYIYTHTYKYNSSSFPSLLVMSIMDVEKGLVVTIL